MVFFSIIVPIYNVAQYLRECLDSVLAQTFSDWEAICVDDGSTDGSGEILDEYALKDKRFKVLRQSNSGVVVAREKGMSFAKGKYVAWIDSDDWVDPDYLQNFYAVINRNQVDVITSDYIEERQGSFALRAYAGSESWDCFLEAMLLNRASGALWGKAFKVSKVKECGVTFEPNFQLAEDMVYITKIMLSQPNIIHIPKHDYHHRVREGSLSVGISNSKEVWWRKVLMSYEYMFSMLKGRVGGAVDAAIYKCKCSLKMSIYVEPNISDQFFYAYHPELRWLKQGRVSIIMKVLLYMAAIGFRPQSLALYKVLSDVKRHLRSGHD